MSTTETKYIETVGRRKTAIARVRIYPGAKSSFIVNNKELAAYFPTRELQNIAQDSFVKSETPEKFKVSVIVRGGGSASQAEAIRHGIARALIVLDPDIRKKIKKFGLLKRDPRSKERRKFGLKKARKAPQWSKR